MKSTERYNFTMDYCNEIYIAAFILLLVGCGSNNNSTSLKVMDSPAAENSRLPFLASDNSGSVFLSWVEPAEEKDTFKLLYSNLKNGEWDKPQAIASSNDWFVNWADYPSIVSHDGRVVAAHALKKIPGNTYSYNVNVFLNENEKSWSAPLTPHFDSTATEHGFVSMAPWNDKVLAIWLDGRRSHNRSEEEYFDLNKAMTLRSAIIDQNGTITQKKLIDQTVCDCCNTSIAATSEGAIAAYRNRTDDEIRDIYVSRFNGTKWSQPQSVHNDNWKIGACPVNGPAIAASDSTVVVAWFTAADGERIVKAAFSTDNNQPFSEPMVINEGKPLGRVDAVINKDGNAFISWIEKSDEQATLKVRKISADQRPSSTVTIAKMNTSRESGFPQMELAGEHLIFAWTEVDSTTSVKTATLPLAYFN